MKDLKNVKNFDMNCLNGCRCEVVNKHFKLCLKCNNLRLYGSEYGKQYNDVKKQKRPFNPPLNNNKPKIIMLHNPKKSRVMYSLDELFYERCFNLSDHRCEECRSNLPDRFRDDCGKIIARWRYSHVVPKSIASNLRHIVENINHLCLKCHMLWENGDKRSMKIFEKNKKNFPQYFKDI